MESIFKNKKALFTIANCYFRIKNLIHESLPKLHLLSELERDGDLLRLKELEQKDRALHFTQNLKELERQLEEEIRVKTPQSELIPHVESWVEQSIADCIFKFRKSVAKNNKKNQKETVSFRSKFQTQSLMQRDVLNGFLFCLEKPSKEANQKAFLNKNPEFKDDLDAHLLLFFRLLAVKYRLHNPLSGGKPWTVSESLMQVLETRTVTAGLKYLVLLRTLCAKKKPNGKKQFKQPRIK